MILPLLFWGLLRKIYTNTNLRPYTSVDLVSMDTISNLVPNPNGKSAIYLNSKYDYNTNTKKVRLDFIDIESGNITIICHIEANKTSNFVWYDEENLLYLYDGKVYKHKINHNDEKYKKNPPIEELYRFTGNITSFKYNRKANLLVFSSYVDSPDPMKKFDSALVYNELFVKHWDHFVRRGKVQLFSIKLNEKHAKELLKGTGLESPVDFSGGSSDYNISPDGKWLAFGAKNPDREQAWQTEQNIYIVPTNGKNKPKELTKDNHGAATRPIFSPDGRYLSWLQMSIPGYESCKRKILLYDLQNKTKRFVAETWDFSPASNLFGDNSENLILTAIDKGHNKIFYINLNTGIITELTDKHTATMVSNFGTDRLIFGMTDFSRPSDIYTISIELGIKSLDRHTISNDKYLENVFISEPEEFWFTGALNETVHGFLFKPINFDPNETYPVSLMAHGGPQGAWTDRFFTNHNFNVHASAGMVVVAINFHASVGYGQKFVDSVFENWGSYPYEDHIKGLDYLLETRSYMDGSRVCVLGTSFGGYMVNWMNGHTDRFKCFVQADGIFDNNSFYYTTDELYFPEHDLGGTPWENPDLYRKWSPSTYINKWKTPTLVIQGQKDYRIVDGEAFATFTALQRRNITSRLLYFPDESHGVTKSPNIVRFMNETVNWVRQFTD